MHSGEKKVSICIVYSGILILVGLSSIVLLALTNSLQVTTSLRFASFVLLVAWLLASQDFYSELIDSNLPMIQRASPLLLLAFGYVITWFGFIALSYKGSYWATLCIYGAGLLFLLGAKYSSNRELRARLSDDLFFIILIMGVFVFIRAWYSPRESATATVFGALLSFLLPIFSFNQEITNSVITALTNITVIEYYVYSILVLRLVLMLDIPRSRHLVPSTVLWHGSNLLGIMIILIAMRQPIVALFSENGEALWTVTTVFNIIIATFGIFFLGFVKRPQ